MSFDIGVFFTKKPHSDDDAAERYLAYCSGDDLKPWIEASPKVAAFIEDLTERYPPIDEVSDEALDDCPWSASLDVSDGHVLMPMTFSKADEMVPFLVELAARHGLVCFDPQAGRILSAPDGLHVAETAPTLEEEDRVHDAEIAPFVAVLDDLLKPRGFSRRRMRWRKDGDKAIIAFEARDFHGIVELDFYAWFKGLGEAEPREVKSNGRYHLRRDVVSDFLPEALTFRMMRAVHLGCDYADSVPGIYPEELAQQIATYFEPREDLTLELRLDTLREAVERHVLPFFDRIEAGDHEGIFAEEAAKEEEEYRRALEQVIAKIKAAVVTCRELRDDGAEDRPLLDAVREQVSALSSVALVLCLAFDWPLAEARKMMEASGLRWTGFTQDTIDDMIQDHGSLVRHDDGRIELRTP